MKYFVLFLLFLSLPVHPARADDGMPLTYSRTNIIIMRDSMGNALPPLPWQGEQVSADSPGIVFDVEVRSAMTLYNQKGWYNLSDPSEKSGVMMMFNAPGIAPVSRAPHYVPLDVLLVDKEGIITQIIPNLMLSELEQDILPAQPVLAFLFLKGGICEILEINPGDRVVYKRFKRPPAVLSAPAAAPKPNPQPVPQPLPFAEEKPLPEETPAVDAAPKEETRPADVRMPAQQFAPARRSTLMIPVQ